jgi:NADPH2:quinone reductase
MTEPLVVPGDDGAGVIDRVGEGVPAGRVGERVWTHSATYTSPLGTCAEYVVVPAANAVRLPDEVDVAVGACLGVPALTAYRCVFGGGSVDGRTVLVTGGAGAVGHYAIELAKHGGARVIATASSGAKQEAAAAAGADVVVDYRRPDAADRIAELARPDGVALVVDVDFAANLPLTTAVTAQNGTIATYSSNSDAYPRLPFYELMRRSITIRPVLVFQASQAELDDGTALINDLLATGALTHPIGGRYALAETAAAHEALESGSVTGKLLIEI